MRLNQFIAHASGLSRRAADQAIADNRVTVNEHRAYIGQTVQLNDVVTLDGQVLNLPESHTTIMLNKPPGYVCSREGQGSKTIYKLLPEKYHSLKPVGRLDKNSSGLLLLTDDGELANRLTHPSFKKEKVYEVKLDKEVSKADFEQITKRGVELDDGPSRFKLVKISGSEWKVIMSEGRNRQIRRTFQALGYAVSRLHRTSLGDYALGKLPAGECKVV